MSVEKLKEVLPSPVIALDSMNWERVEKRYSIVLPADFKLFIKNYGTGCIDDFLWVLNPFSENENINFETSEYLIESYKVMQEEFPRDYIRPLYPKTGSFFPWAITDNGDSFGWIIDGEPNEWKVVIFSQDQGEEEVYNMSATELLYKLLITNVRSSLLPAEFPSETISFSQK